jgi:hypothetical protein
MGDKQIPLLVCDCIVYLFTTIITYYEVRTKQSEDTSGNQYSFELIKASINKPVIGLSNTLGIFDKSVWYIKQNLVMFLCCFRLNPENS